jgi:hypothetical protein
LIRLHVVGPFRVRRWRVGPVIRIGRLRGRWPIIAGWPVRLRIRRHVGRAIWLIRLHVVWPFRVRRRHAGSVVLRHVARLLERAIYILRRRWPITRVLRSRCHPSCDRSHSHLRLRLLLLLDLAHLRDPEGTATVLLNGLLLSLESCRWRRRSGLGDNCAGHDGIRRPCARRPTGALDGLPRRGHRRCRCNDLSTGHFSLINPHRVVVHGLPAGEGLRGSGRHGTRHGLVDIPDVGHIHVFIDHHIGVVVVDHGGVHRGVGDVHIVHVGAADRIGRHVDFARS